MTYIQVYIIEKNDLIREGIKSFVGGRNYKVIAEFKNIENVAAPEEFMAPQLFIIGINIRILSAYNAQEEITKFKIQLDRIRKEFSDSHIILLISQEALYHIPDLYSWDVDGYICREVTKEGFLNYLNLAMMGERIIPAPVACHHNNGIPMFYKVQNKIPSQDKDVDPPLSTREKDILRCIAYGNPNKVIAGELKITESTVKVHLKTILRKLGVNNRTQAALWAMKNGLNGAAESFLILYIYGSHFRDFML